MNRFPQPTPNRCKAKKEQEEKEHDNGVRGANDRENSLPVPWIVR